MKQKMLLFMALICSVSLYAQNVSLSFNQVKLERVLASVTEQTGYSFAYSEPVIDPAQLVSINVSNTDVKRALKTLFDDSHIAYEIRDKKVFLSAKAVTNTSNSTVKGAKIVQGRITNASGESLPAVNVIIKGTTIRAFADMDGNYSIPIPDNIKDPVLRFVFMGYTEQELAVGNRGELSVVLTDDVSKLDEVIVVGYGTQKKGNLTGSLEIIKSDRLANKPVTSLASTLTGEASGVTVTQNSGLPGPDQGKVRIRGIGTWGNAEPLVLVDGIAMNMNDVIPSEVASVTILKDAASAAIYGSRAANGVILITTKQGKEGKMRINYDGNFGIQRATRVPKMVSSWEYGELYNQMMDNEGKPSSLFPADRLERMRNGGDPDLLEGNTDWFKELLRSSAPQQNHQASLSGGSESITYMASMGYSNQEGIIPTSAYQRYNLRINTTATLTSWLKLGVNLAYTNGAQKEAVNGGAEAFRRAAKGLPYMPVKFSDGTWSFRTTPANPVRMATEDYGLKQKANENINTLISPEINLLGNSLLIKGLFGYESSTYKDKRFDKRVEYEAFVPAGQTGTTEIPRNKQTDKWEQYRNLTANTTVTYLKQVDQHNFKIMGGGSAETFKYAYTMASRQDFPNNDFSEINAGDKSTAEGEGNSTYAALASAFGRFNYDFNNRYLFEASIRYDGSSKFARGKRWGTFPSFSAGWRISEETFFQNMKQYIPSLKLRASWGKLGNQRVDNYQYLSTIGEGGNYIFDGMVSAGYKETLMGNKLITWESSTNKNIGLDVSLISSKLQITADWYQRKTDDILLQLAAPSTLGIKPPMENAGTVQNTGWDLNITWRDQIGADFNYYVNLNLSDVKNEIKDLRGYKSPTNDLTTRIEGQPLDALFGYKTLGIAENQALYDQYHKMMQAYNPKWGLGDIIIEDRTGEGKIDVDDKTIIGSSVPRYTFGVNLGFEYKGFDFSCFFQGVGKADGYMGSEGLQSMGNNSARKDHYTDTFNPKDPKAGMYYPRIMDADYNYANMSHWVQNAAYVRLKNLQLGYTFNIPNINKFRLYVSAQNLFTITKFRTWDPESPVGARGIYPNVSIYSMGVNLNF